MAEPELKVEADNVRAVAANVDGVGSRYRELLSRFEGQVAGLGRPWGDDSYGQQFHDGGGGWGNRCASGVAWGSAQAGVLRNFAVLLGEAADFFQVADQG